MAADDRSCHEVDTRKPSISLRVVQVCEWAICSVFRLAIRTDDKIREILPVDVSFTHVAILPRISVLVFLLVTAAAKNSQSLFVYRCLESRGSPYLWRTAEYQSLCIWYT